jgi:hypothetical protein
VAYENRKIGQGNNRRETQKARSYLMANKWYAGKEKLQGPRKIEK